MITKEQSSTKKCCFYASDFHLEMILLPYIKQRLDKYNFVILTQDSLQDSVKILLDRTNLVKEEKERILNINWMDEYIEKILYINNYIDNSKKLNVIINGNKNFIDKIKEKITLNKNIELIDCFKYENVKENAREIALGYDDVLNMNTINE